MLNLGHLVLIIVYSGFSRIPDSISYSASAIMKNATKHKYNYDIFIQANTVFGLTLIKDINHTLEMMKVIFFFPVRVYKQYTHIICIK